jgi:hypothetical protein
VTIVEHEEVYRNALDVKLPLSIAKVRNIRVWAFGAIIRDEFIRHVAERMGSVVAGSGVPSAHHNTGERERRRERRGEERRRGRGGSGVPSASPRGGRERREKRRGSRRCREAPVCPRPPYTRRQGERKGEGEGREERWQAGG